MSFENVERLKKQFTDKYVVADFNQPELRRFKGLTGQVKTVNMSGRALVQFQHPVDISWYDIDFSYLRVVDKPLPKVEVKKEAAKPVAAAKPAAPAAAAPGEAAAPAAKKSPLELARAQALAKAGGAAPASPAAAPAAAKPLSKIEQARQQAGLKAAAAAAPAAVAAAPVAPPPAAPVPAAPAAAKAAVPTTGPDGKPLSKIELARLQGAFKG